MMNKSTNSYPIPNVPDSFTADTLIQVCQYRAQTQKDSLALAFLDENLNIHQSLSYESLDCWARSIAQKLLQCKEKELETALLLFPPGLPYVAAFLGCLYAGVVAVPAYPVTNVKDFHRLTRIAEDCDASFILSLEEHLPSIQFWLTQTSLDNPTCIPVGKEPSKPNEAAITPTTQSLAFLQYTSGSTGDPKGVMVTHANLMENSAAIYQSFGHTADSIGVIWLPPYHDMGLIGGILQPLYGGFPVYLMSPFTFLKQPKRWLEAISRYGATSSGGPNFAYELAMKHADRSIEALELSQWLVAFTGAEPIRNTTIEKFYECFAQYGFNKEAFYPCYGLAESTLIASGGDHRSPIVSVSFCNEQMVKGKLIAIESSEKSNTLVSSGNSIENSILIVDPETCTILPEGSIGEIWISGPSIAQGYWKKTEITQQVFGALTNCGKGPYLRSGDLGSLINEELFVTGRIKELIIIDGKNHYPTDIECSIQELHESVMKKGCGVAFSSVIGEVENLILVQEIRKEAIAGVDIDQLKSAVRRTVQQRHALATSDILFLPPGSLPKTSSGKLKRVELKQMYLQGDLDSIVLG